MHDDIAALQEILEGESGQHESDEVAERSNHWAGSRVGERPCLPEDSCSFMKIVSQIKPVSRSTG